MTASVQQPQLIADQGPARRALLAPLLKANGVDLALSMVNIGALPLKGEEEPYWQLLDEFPAAKVAAVELDAHLCDELNRHAPRNVRYYPAAIGRTEERRPLYRTVHPMCTSLYRPDERYADLFQGLDDQRLKKVGEAATVSLDTFVNEHAIGAVDFLKIDVQGAELDVLKGGAGALGQVLLIVSEVEFVPIYEGQPLFGDVAAHLRAQGMQFHKFLGIGGRVMKPFAMQGSTEYPAQFMWSDAIFVRDYFALDALSAEQLLKLAVLLDVYECCDTAHAVLRRYDAAESDDLAPIYLAHLSAAGVWGAAAGGGS